MAGHGHGHSHSHGGCGDDSAGIQHDHEDEAELAIQYSLYQKVLIDQVICLNEAVDGSGKQVFKAWHDRLDRARYVESDADEELLFNIPFSGNVKLKAIVLIGGEGNSHPSKARLYKNRPKMTFDDVAGECDQEFALIRDDTGRVEYPLKIAKFSSVNHLSIYLPTNFGHNGDEVSSKVYYIGFRGDFLGEHRDEVVICTYEARPLPQDHKGEIRDVFTSEIS